MTHIIHMAVPHNVLQLINAYCSPAANSPHLGRNEKIIYSAMFAPGVVMDIKCYAANDVNNPAWTKAALFMPAPNGVGLQEVAHTNPNNQYDGEWTLTYGDDVYTVIVTDGGDITDVTVTDDNDEVISTKEAVAPPMAGRYDAVVYETESDYALSVVDVQIAMQALVDAKGPDVCFVPVIIQGDKTWVMCLIEEHAYAAVDMATFRQNVTDIINGMTLHTKDEIIDCDGVRVMFV